MMKEDDEVEDEEPAEEPTEEPVNQVLRKGVSERDMKGKSATESLTSGYEDSVAAPRINPIQEEKAEEL